MNFFHAMLQRYKAVCILLLLLCSRVLMPDGFSQTCSSAQIVAFGTTPLGLNTYNDLVNGGTASRYLSAQINTYRAGRCPNWKMTVRATGNFTNGTDELDLRYVSIRFNTVAGGPSGAQIGIPTNSFILSQNETTLIPRSNVPIDVTRYQTYQIQYDMTVQGGNQLLVLTNGEYATNLVFNLYDENGNLFSTSTMRAVFQIYYSGNWSSTVRLQNGANNVVMNFNTPESIAEGVKINIIQGLAVQSYSSHQIIAKAANNRLISGSGGGLDFIPMSVIRFTVDVYGPFYRIMTSSILLSSIGRVVVDNPMTDYTYQNVTYNLRFVIEGNNPSIVAAAPGNYVSSVVLSLVPR
jgi:hypothetical protein